MVERIDTGLAQPANETEWLQQRLHGIGASEASAIIGKNPYMTNQQLWYYKTQRRSQRISAAKPVCGMGMRLRHPSGNFSP